MQYDFATEDIGEGAVEDGTTIKWFVTDNDGAVILFKEGIFSEIGTPPEIDPKSLLPTELGPTGEVAHLIGNQVQVEVTPRTQNSTGVTIVTPIITVVNSVPVITTIQITLTSEISLIWIIDDIDIANGVQSDQSQETIRWWVSPNQTDFVIDPSLNGLTVVPANSLSPGQSWFASQSPSDGADLGVEVSSNTVVVV